MSQYVSAFACLPEGLGHTDWLTKAAALAFLSWKVWHGGPNDLKGKCDHSSNTEHSSHHCGIAGPPLAGYDTLSTTVVANFHDLLTLKKPYAEGSSFTSIVVSSRGKFNRLFHIFRWIWEQCMRWTEKNTPIELSIMNALDFSFETQMVEEQVRRITVGYWDFTATKNSNGSILWNWFFQQRKMYQI